MAVITFSSLNKSYGGYDVLKDVSFDLNAKEKVALIGRNGTGKTTIFNIIANGLEYDGGNAYVEKGLRIGYLQQLYSDFGEKTAKTVIEEAFCYIREIESSMSMLRKQMSEDPHNINLIKAYSELNEKFEFYEGYSLNEKFNRVIKGLGIPDDVISNQASKLSGGELTMIMLAKVLLMNPDILLLDEPTNHLDSDACEWLERYINDFKGTVLYISHDRYFIDNTAMKVLYLQDGSIKEYRGNYSAYLIQRIDEQERHLKLYERQEREIGRLRETALKMRNYGTEIAIKRAKNLEKRMERMDIYDKPVTEKELRLTFQEEEKVAKEIFYVKNIEKSFGNKMLFKDISFIMRSGDKIALIGPNGAGKSTLIKIITGQIEADNGIVKRPKSVKYAYLEQNVSFPDETLTVLELICSQLDFTIQSARNLLGKFLFSDEDVFKKVSNLSGGEKSRLRLLIEMQQGVNLLILDEPTNHLDISAREEIEEALSMFGGSMIFISHDRHFVNKFAQRIFEIEDGSFNIYEGNYDYYLSKKQALIQQDKIAKPSVKKPFEGKKEKRKSDMIKRTLEQDIEHTEFELDVLTTEIEKYATDYEKLLHLVEKKDLLSEHLELLYEQWLGIEEE